MILKKDGRREIFDRQKIIKAIQMATQKRPVTDVQIEQIASKIESKLRTSAQREIKSTKIGEMIVRQLKKLDQVSYIRFVSVYNDFKDIESFKKELEKLETTQ